MDVKCSQATVEYIEKYGGKAIMWKTGHSLIKEKMKEEKALLAGEMSGHMFFKDNYLGFDDALFASLRLLEILSKNKEKFSQLVDEIPNYYSTPEIRIDCPEQEKFKVVEQLKKYFRGKYKTIDIDGVRILFENGWGLIRASNTQPVLVLRFEAKTNQALQEIKNEIKKKLEEYPFITAEI
jgi:phosphomannomutase/phosphoglucomutase